MEHSTANDSMIIPALCEIEVSFTLVLSVPLPGSSSQNCVPVPSRLRKSRSTSWVSALPT